MTATLQVKVFDAGNNQIDCGMIKIRSLSSAFTLSARSNSEGYITLSVPSGETIEVTAFVDRAFVYYQSGSIYDTVVPCDYTFGHGIQKITLNLLSGTTYNKSFHLQRLEGDAEILFEELPSRVVPVGTNLHFNWGVGYYGSTFKDVTMGVTMKLYDWDNSTLLWQGSANSITEHLTYLSDIDIPVDAQLPNGISGILKVDWNFVNIPQSHWMSYGVTIIVGEQPPQIVLLPYEKIFGSRLINDGYTLQDFYIDTYNLHRYIIRENGVDLPSPIDLGKIGEGPPGYNDATIHNAYTQRGSPMWRNGVPYQEKYFHRFYETSEAQCNPCAHQGTYIDYYCQSGETSPSCESDVIIVSRRQILTESPLTLGPELIQRSPPPEATSNVVSTSIPQLAKRGQQLSVSAVISNSSVNTGGIQLILQFVSPLGTVLKMDGATNSSIVSGGQISASISYQMPANYGFDYVIVNVISSHLTPIDNSWVVDIYDQYNLQVGVAKGKIIDFSFSPSVVNIGGNVDLTVQIQNIGNDSGILGGQISFINGDNNVIYTTPVIASTSYIPEGGHMFINYSYTIPSNYAYPTLKVSLSAAHWLD